MGYPALSWPRIVSTSCISHARSPSCADEIFARDEIDAALLLFKKHRRMPRPLGSTPLLGTMVDIIARLGGYIGKSSGGPPGIKTFGRGMDRVADAAEVVAMLRANGHMPTSNDGFG
ncbi:MAG: hypothetical protein IPN17_30840 [Deltaproteobacteria bacterium]|nr:hypothetical protein [Deltaproteobacteria bacterium]